MFVAAAVVVVIVTARLLDKSRDEDDDDDDDDDVDDQQMDIILKAMNIKAMSIVVTIPMKYGAESCVLATISKHNNIN